MYLYGYQTLSMDPARPEPIPDYETIVKIEGFPASWKTSDVQKGRLLLLASSVVLGFGRPLCTVSVIISLAL